MEEILNPYHTLLDETPEDVVDEDNVRWGLAVPADWINRHPKSVRPGTIRDRLYWLRAELTE